MKRKNSVKNFLKQLFIFSAFGLGLFPLTSLGADSFETKQRIRKTLAAIKEEKLLKNIHTFVEATRPNRIFGGKGHRAAAQWIISEIARRSQGQGRIIHQKENLPLREIERFYRSKVEKSRGDEETAQMSGLLKSYAKSVKKKKVHNIIWVNGVRASEGDKKLIIHAHYDNMAVDWKERKIPVEGVFPGADHNASGVIVALEILTLLVQNSAKFPVEIVFTGLQSLAFAGSYIYAQSLNPAEVKMVLNLEMLGHDSKLFDRRKKHGNMASYTRSGVDGQSEVVWWKEFHARAKGYAAVKFPLRKNDFAHSDNIRFWDRDIDSITFSQNWEDDFNETRYMTKNDFPETLNYKTLKEAIRYLGGGILSMVHSSSLASDPPK